AVAVPDPEPHQGAAAGRALGGDGAAVRLGDLAHDREPEARAGHPPRRRGAVEALEDVGRSPSAIPGPRSLTVSSPSARRTSTGSPAGLHLAALSSRLPIARSRLALTPTTVVGSRCATIGT